MSQGVTPKERFSMHLFDLSIQFLLGMLLILSSLGVILLKNPVHASLSFLVTLMTVAVFFLELSAEFIAVMQVLIYAGAILVIFIFALVLFQDAYQQIYSHPAKVGLFPSFLAITTILALFTFFYHRMKGLDYTAMTHEALHATFGTAEGIGRALYTQYLFPFEAVVLLFLVALVGSLYLAKKEN